MAIHSSFLPGKFRGQRSLAGYSPWARKELDMPECHVNTQTHTGYLLVAVLLVKTVPEASSFGSTLPYRKSKL